jgi:hypothetical protein
MHCWNMLDQGLQKRSILFSEDWSRTIFQHVVVLIKKHLDGGWSPREQLHTYNQSSHLLDEFSVAMEKFWRTVPCNRRWLHFINYITYLFLFYIYLLICFFTVFGLY